MLNLKRVILHTLQSNDLETVVWLSKENRKVLSELVRLAYDKETLLGWRAIKAIGLAARELVKIDPAFLRETMRKLLWSLSDESGGIGWSAPEILGEIVSAHPERFRDIIPLIAEVYDIEEKVFRPGILYALARIADVNPALVVSYKSLAIRALSDENPQARIYGVDLLAKLISKLSKEELDAVNDVLHKLSSDKAEAWIYRDTDFVNVQVREAVERLTGKKGGIKK